MPAKNSTIPETPLKILVPDSILPPGPFFVRSLALAVDGKMRDINEEEVAALAQLIFNAYIEWKQQ